MSTYETGATTHAANDAVLSIINDGSGEMCGYSYEQRLESARQLRSVVAMRHAARNYGRYRVKHFGAPNLTRAEWVEAGNLIAAYYDDLIREELELFQRKQGL